MPRITAVSKPPAPVDRLSLRPREAAIALGICERTLLTWTKAGKIPSFRVGGSVRYSVKLLEQWMAEQSNQTAADDSAAA